MLKSCRYLGLSTVLAVSVCHSANGLETDQLLGWGVELEDSATALNEFVNGEIDGLLAKLARKGRTPACEDVTKKVYKRVFPSLLRPRIRRRLIRDYAIDRYPGEDVGYFEHLKSSIYRKPAFPFILPLCRTMRVGDVYLGTDKLGHFFGQGRRYYKRYLKEREAGASELDAVTATVRKGVKLEATVVGGLVDGVFSHADLEANYQGMLLARSFCEGPDPVLVRTSAGWARGHDVDMRAFVNPAFDESYNTSSFKASRWKRVRPVIEAEYCPRIADDDVLQRYRRYDELDAESFSRRLIREEYQSQGRHVQAEYSVAAVCATTTAALR
ncbi:MAG: hypothetical protein VYE73_06290 [Acidobacteriota bacterium]|nr:hypothetical protein [Acidobacteriota bacterium]